MKIVKMSSEALVLVSVAAVWKGGNLGTQSWEGGFG